MLLKEIGLIALFTVISLGLFYVIKYYLLNKVTIKKKYLITVMVIVIILPFFFIFLGPNFKIPTWITTVQMIIFTVIFLIYLEVIKMERIKKNKPVVGKPKVKPNRTKDKE